MDTKELPQAVHKGAALLDDRVPSWYDRVDLDTLDMEDVTSCVLGQLGQARGVDRTLVYGAYNYMAEVLGIRSDQLWEHGFDLEDDSEHWGFGITEHDWDTLEILWCGEITMRRERYNARR